MREILFRGKRTDNGEWVEGSLVSALDNGEELWYIIPFSAEQCGGYEFSDGAQVDFWTVGQDTGLQDKNGKRIFEGDVVLFCDRPLIVAWSEETFGWQAKAHERADRRFPHDKYWNVIDLGWIAAEVTCSGQMTTEVIDNIYANREWREPVRWIE